MVGRRIFFWQMVAWWIMPPFESHAVGPSLDVKIDVVEAMRLLASWVSWAFGTNDEQRQRAAREALPSIVTDFLELASVKAQLQREYEKFRKNPVFVSIPASRPARGASADSAPHAGEASELVKAFTNFLFDAQNRLRKIISDLKGRLSSLDPEWRLRNVTSLSIIIETVDGRSANAFFVGSYRRFLLEKLDGDRPLPLRPYSNTTPPPQEITYSLDSPDAKEFFGRQQAEAEELRRLAREVAMTANLKPG